MVLNFDKLLCIHVQCLIAVHSQISCFAEKGGKLAALSVASCQLSDADLSPLCAAVKSGYCMQMLKLSDNRFTDEFVGALCDALQSSKSHPLAVVDLSSNNVTNSTVICMKKEFDKCNVALMTSSRTIYVADTIIIVHCSTKTNM